MNKKILLSSIAAILLSGCASQHSVTENAISEKRLDSFVKSEKQIISNTKDKIDFVSYKKINIENPEDFSKFGFKENQFNLYLNNADYNKFLNAIATMDTISVEDFGLLYLSNEPFNKEVDEKLLKLFTTKNNLNEDVVLTESTISTKEKVLDSNTRIFKQGIEKSYISGVNIENDADGNVSTNITVSKVFSGIQFFVSREEVINNGKTSDQLNFNVIGETLLSIDKMEVADNLYIENPKVDTFVIDTKLSFNQDGHFIKYNGKNTLNVFSFIKEDKIKTEK